jgi:hypothetical protein
MTLNCDLFNGPLLIQWLYCHPPPQNQRSSQPPPLTVLVCIINGLQCLFPPITILGHASPRTTDVSLFQRNCVHCTQSHQRCVFHTDSPTQCKRCIKLQVTCLFNLSFQGCRNDLIAPTDAIDPNWRPANANESAHYHHSFDGDSCHGCVDPVTVEDLGVCVKQSI